MHLHTRLELIPAKNEGCKVPMVLNITPPNTKDTPKEHRGGLP